MNKQLETIRRYFLLGLYSQAHLEMLEAKGGITAEERQAIEKGE